jgi:hypothetical protein
MNELKNRRESVGRLVTTCRWSRFESKGRIPQEPVRLDTFKQCLNHTYYYHYYWYNGIKNCEQKIAQE